MSTSDFAALSEGAFDSRPRDLLDAREDASLRSQAHVPQLPRRVCRVKPYDPWVEPARGPTARLARRERVVRRGEIPVRVYGIPRITPDGAHCELHDTPGHRGSRRPMTASSGCMVRPAYTRRQSCALT